MGRSRHLSALFIGLGLTGCAVDASPTLDRTDTAATRLEEASGWTDLTADGDDCSFAFPATTISAGQDASFILGMSTSEDPRGRAHLDCKLRGAYVVPAGYYLESFSVTLGYGVLKPAGNKVTLRSRFALHVPDGRGKTELRLARDLEVDDPFAVDNQVLDVKDSQKRLCDGDDHTVDFKDAIDLRLAARTETVIASVDSVDLHVDVAPCPPREEKKHRGKND